MPGTEGYPGVSGGGFQQPETATNLCENMAGIHGATASNGRGATSSEEEEARFKVRLDATMRVRAAAAAEAVRLRAAAFATSPSLLAIGCRLRGGSFSIPINRGQDRGQDRG
jgi:hypothetical protein